MPLSQPFARVFGARYARYCGFQQCKLFNKSLCCYSWRLSYPHWTGAQQPVRQPLSLSAAAVNCRAVGLCPIAGLSYLITQHSGPQSLPVVQQRVQHIGQMHIRAPPNRVAQMLEARCCDSCFTRSARCTADSTEDRKVKINMLYPAQNAATRGRSQAQHNLHQVISDHS